MCGRVYTFWIVLVASQILFIEGFLIGEPCKYDDECFVDHSYCEMQQFCQCKDGFIETEDRETCIAMVGAYCHSKYDCSSLPNSACKEDRCVCDSGFVSDAEGTKCMPVISHIEVPCEEDFQCRPKFGVNSRCVPRKGCECNPGYHYDGTCLYNMGLGMICHNSSECYIGEEFRDKITCNGGHCACKDGFYEFERRACERSGSTQLNIISMWLLLLCCAFSVVVCR